MKTQTTRRGLTFAVQQGDQTTNRLAVLEAIL